MTEQELNAARYVYIREYIYLSSHNVDADFIRLSGMNSKDFDAEVDRQMKDFPKGRKPLRQSDEEGAIQQYALRLEDV